MIPFVKLWYTIPSSFLWADDDGTKHRITQGDGGEQGDAMMPGLFSLALHPALERIRQELADGS